MITIKFTTKIIKRPAKVVLRTALDWDEDLTGKYYWGAWRFKFDEKKIPVNGLYFKFAITPDGYMEGENLHIDPPTAEPAAPAGEAAEAGKAKEAKKVYEYTDTQVRFPPPPAGCRRPRGAAVVFRNLTCLLLLLLIPPAGTAVGYVFLHTAQQRQSCASTAATASWKGVQLSGLPSTLQSSFGYGRGTQIIDASLNATAQRGTTLQKSYLVFAEPLVTSNGSQLIRSLSDAGKTPATPARKSHTKKPAKPARQRAKTARTAAYQAKSGSAAPGKTAKPVAASGKHTKPEPVYGISATATRIGLSSTYLLQICIRAPSATPGAYSSQLLFPQAKLASGASLPVTVTFQSRLAPFTLWVGVPVLALLGLVYTTVVLIRRGDNQLVLSGLPTRLLAQLLSINGLLALITSVGTVYLTWLAQVYKNPTWGGPWPGVLATLGTMIAVGATAATVPMGLSKGGG